MQAFLFGVPRRTRRRIPRAISPTMIERDYAREIGRLVDRVRLVFADVMRNAPALLEGARRERLDAGEPGRLRALIEEAKTRLTSAIDLRAIEELARMTARRTELHQKAQLIRQARTALGVDVLFTDRKLAAAMEGFVAENVTLIRTIPIEVATGIEKLITRGASSGMLWRDIAKDVEGQFGMGRQRAQLIARDQVGKFYGQVNETRQKEVGLDDYIWRTARDRRVRGTPGGAFPNVKHSHYVREGQRFKWSAPPPDGHPGEPILCRCYAEPSFEKLFAEFELDE